MRNKLKLLIYRATYFYFILNRVLVLNHWCVLLRKLCIELNTPVMKRSNAVRLRNIIDTVAALRGSLLSFGSESDLMNSMLVHVVLIKIDSDSKWAYDQKQEVDYHPSWV